MKIKDRMYGLKTVLRNRKYLLLFISLFALFSFIYIFAWNLILIPNFYIRTDSWTLTNILFLIAISILSGLSITLSVFNLKTKTFIYKGRYGYFAVIPAFFTSACPGCAPLLLSFASTTFAIGLSLAKFDILIKTISTLTLLMTIFYFSLSIKCNTKR